MRRSTGRSGSRRSRGVAPGFGLACALLGIACGASPELVLVLHSDLEAPDELDEVEIEVESPAGRATPIRVPLAQANNASPATFPLTLGLRPAGTAGDVTVDVRAKLEGSVVVGQRARTNFVGRQSRLLTMELLAACRGVTCSAGATCGASGCRSENLPGSILPAWNGLLPAAPADTHDAGADGGSSFVAEMTDDFDDATLDPFKWTIGWKPGMGPADGLTGDVKVAERDGALTIEPVVNRGLPSFNGYLSLRQFDFRGGIAVVEVPGVTQNGGETVFAIFASGGPTATFQFRVRWDINQRRNFLWFDDTTSGMASDQDSYRPSLHRVWRFRRAEEANTLHWETAPSLNGPFTVRRSVSLSASVFTQVRVALYAGTRSRVTENPGAARFDSVAIGRTP